MISENVFILTGDWLDVNGRNILRFWGITEKRDIYEIIVDNVKPVFFIERKTALQNILRSFKRKEVKLKSFNGWEVDALYFNSQKELKDAAQKLDENLIHTYEADVDPVKRYLMERFINVQMNVQGEPAGREGYVRIKNPIVKTCDLNTHFKTISLDIETGTRSGQVYSIAVNVRCGGDESNRVFMLGENRSKRKSKVTEFFKSEDEMLSSFINWFKDTDPDIIIGWHVIGFDLMFLERRCQELGINFNIARGSGRISLRARKSGRYFASIPGRIVIDGPPALRSAFYTFEDYKLETVAQELLGTGKTITPEQNKIKEIEHLFKNDKNKLAEYNLNDAILVSDIFKKTGLIEQSVTRAKLSGLFMDQLGMMTAAFDHFFLPRIHRAGYVAPNTKDLEEADHLAGGYVIDPKPGIYDNVIVLDFKSLYPSIIMTFKIDPLSRLESGTDTITTPAGYRLSATKNFLPSFIEKLMEQRSEAKKKKDKYLSQAIKILMNSFYGVMGSYGCRFFHPDLPSAITSTGQWLLLGSKEYLEHKGFEVLYGDTDSLFVKLKDENEPADNSGESIARVLNDYWKIRLKDEFNVESHLEIEYEKYYKKFILTPARGGETGAKKRYAGLLATDDGDRLDFVGMEFVRSDWTKLAKEFQVELYERIFKNKEIDDWIRSIVNAVKNGELNEKLVYRKHLRKNIDSYTKNIPPQVRAAKLLGLNNKSIIYYFITKRGPVPVELDHSDIDYQHYIDKQLKPIADSVLVLLGKSFDAIAGSNQINMFD